MTKKIKLIIQLVVISSAKPQGVKYNFLQQNSETKENIEVSKSSKQLKIILRNVLKIRKAITEWYLSNLISLNCSPS